MFVNRVNISSPISAICLNECWLTEKCDQSTIHLPNYQMFYQRGTREGHSHCGLIIYVHEQFTCREITVSNESTAWDYMCIELSHKSPNSKKHILCNVYRLPGGTVEELSTFTDEFSSFLETLKHMRLSAFVCGDYNINLLQIHSNHNVNTFFERVTSNSFFPRITLPTRLAISGTSSTLIDNIFTNNIEEDVNSRSGILINDLSDHTIIFTFQYNCKYQEQFPKFIEIEKKDEHSVNNFIDELKSLKIYDQLNNTSNCNPNENYTIFSTLVSLAKDKHLPKKENKI